MKKQSFLPILALVLGIAASAFTSKQATDSDLVWFEVNQSGAAVHPDEGMQGESSPFNCNTGSLKCATALSISAGEVVLNSDGITYSIETGVDISSDLYYDQREFKNQ